jgi:hypothetical protein
MEDTPKNIKELQLKKWLEKKPGERLAIALKTNEELYITINELKKNYEKTLNKI